MYLPQTISQAQSNNTRAKNWLVIVYCRLGVGTQSTLRGVKPFNSASTITSFTHHHTGTWQWEQNEDILTSSFE